mmetsp:Transcript_10234/g.13969  ORF Transcript_10234/g.13969 Transcript_10234/m.13969 type:complete len:124 (+) Transcript_10234:291-662(+)
MSLPFACSSASSACCKAHMDVYFPFLRRSAKCEPSSMTLPSCSTIMRSQSLMVDRRCATVMEVRPLERPWREAWMPCSVAESSAEVASSHTTSRGRRTKARAIATRCFSPPESFSPRSPTTVL